MGDLNTKNVCQYSEACKVMKTARAEFESHGLAECLTGNNVSKSPKNRKLAFNLHMRQHGFYRLVDILVQAELPKDAALAAQQQVLKRPVVV